ncbi:MAG: DUF362 domain-containing protein [Polyangiaceae bacterium]
MSLLGDPSKPPFEQGTPADRARPSRREMLVRAGTMAGVFGASAVGARLLWDKGGFGVEQAAGARQVRDYRIAERDAEHAELAIATAPPKEVGDDSPHPTATPEQLVRRAVAAMGGMARFVSRGDVVAVKPNIGWDRMPIHAANTNPDVVAAVVKLAFEAGAKRVVVADGSCNDPSRCFQRSGIWRAAYAVGADVVLPEEHRFRTMRLNGDVLDEWPVFTALVDADKVINVPVAKHHNLAKYTAAMKNWYGVLGGRRNRLHQSIDESIADLATFMRPTLVVVDAWRVLMRNGPQGGNIDDAKNMYKVFASVDQVAADAYGCALIGQKRENLPYLALGEQRGLGTTRFENLRVREV